MVLAHVVDEAAEAAEKPDKHEIDWEGQNQKKTLKNNNKYDFDEEDGNILRASCTFSVGIFESIFTVSI